MMQANRTTSDERRQHELQAWCGRTCLLLACAALIGFAAPARAAIAGTGTAISVGVSTHDHPQGYLGIQFHDASNEQVAALHLSVKHPVEVLMVDHDGPAGEAGLQPHDIVLMMNSKEIDHADDLHNRLRNTEPGTLITLTVARSGRVMTLTAKLANQTELEHKAWLDHMSIPGPPGDVPDAIVVEQYNGDPPPSGPQAVTHGQSFLGSVLHAAPYTGLDLQVMEPQLAGFFGAPPHTGLLVHAVEVGSPGAVAGLRAGDVVLKVNAASVKSTSQWTKQVRGAKDGNLTLTILRDKHEQSVLLTPDTRHH